MGCEEQVRALEEAAERVQRKTEASLREIATDAEARTAALATEFDHDQDLAAGVGAAAGTAIGAALGGAAGAGAGAVVGRAIGSLFVLEVANEEKRIILSVPQATLRRREFAFDVPSVVMRDTDVSFTIPTLVMKRTKGPPVPESVTRWVTRCVGPRWARVCTDVPQVTIEWRDTWLDVPTYEPREHRIVIGMPSVQMRREQVSMSVPEVAMRTTEMIFQVPSIRLRFVKDAGRRVAAAAAAIARDAEAASEKAKLEMKAQMAHELVGPTQAVFACARSELESMRGQIAAPFEPEIEKLTSGLTALKAKGVPDTDDDFIALKQQLDQAIARRNAALAELDKAVAQLTEQQREALEALTRD